MKFTTIYLGEIKIELFNTLLGREIVKVNGEIVSSEFSIAGTEHDFKIIENDVESSCKLVTGFGLHGVVIDLYRDDKPIIESPKVGCLGMLLIIFGFVFLIRFLEWLI
jgi:hypothetical protein